MTFELGWSTSIERRVKRGLARNLVRRPFALPNRPTVSFTFDDVPSSAARRGAPILERHGIRGTFYVAGAICGLPDRYWTLASADDIRDLHASGHEIACHTANHVNVQSLSEPALLRQCDSNDDLIAGMTGAPVSRHFAYPYGDLGLMQKRVLERRFLTCRSIYERLNVGRIDLGCLGAIGLFDRVFDERSAMALLDIAARQGGWLIFYTHDVDDDPTFMGTSPKLLDWVARQVAAMGITCSTIAEATRAYGIAP